MKRLVGTATLLLVLGSCTHSATHDIRVHLFIDTQFKTPGAFVPAAGSPCDPVGASVRFVVNDGAGDAIATRSFPLPAQGVVTDAASPGFDCDVGTFRIAEVPASTVYEFEIEGRSGTLHQSATELEAADWIVAIVGDP